VRAFLPAEGMRAIKGQAKQVALACERITMLEAILIFIGVIALTAVVFGFWLIVTIVRGIFRGAAYIAGVPPRQLPQPTNRSVTCPHDNCHASNPSVARFCRRCGREMPQAQRVNVRRAAMW
jgi:hypothetical protein